jgi:hypothetical protein
MAEELGWNEARIQEEADRYRVYVRGNSMAHS